MIGFRLDPVLERRLILAARARGCSKSDIAREALRRYLDEDDLVREARRQSLLVSDDSAEGDALDFIENTTDWTR